MTDYQKSFDIYHRLKDNRVIGAYQMSKIILKNRVVAFHLKIPVYHPYSKKIYCASGFDFSFEDAFTQASMEACERYLNDYEYQTVNNTDDITNMVKIGSDLFNIFTPLNKKEELKIKYTKVTSVNGFKNIAIPSQLIFGGYFRSGKNKNEPMLRVPISTGLAVSTNRGKSLVKSFEEIIERDNFSLYMFNNKQPRLITNIISDSRLSSFHIINELVRLYGLELFFFDFSYDSPIKVIGSLIIHRKTNFFRMGLGSGTQLDICLYHSFFEAFKQFNQQENCKYNLYSKKELDYYLWKNLKKWQNTNQWSRLDFLFSAKTVSYKDLKEKKKTNSKKTLNNILSFMRRKKFHIFVKELYNELVPDVYAQKIIIPEMIPLYIDPNMKISKLKRNKKFLGNNTSNNSKLPVPFI